MWRDPIVEEIGKYRQEHAAKFDYDLNAIAADVQSREQECGHPLVTLRTKTAGKGLLPVCRCPKVR